MGQIRETGLMKLPLKKSSFSRRELLSAIMRTGAEAVGSIGNEGGFVLSDLPNMTDKELASMRPIVNPEFEIYVERGMVCARSRITGESLELLATEKAELATFNLFNGMHRLDEISERLVGLMNWDQEASFAFVRELFVLLALQQVCIPKDPPALTV